MEQDFKGVLWQQFGAAIDMLENAIDACPDEVWSDPSKRPEWPTNDVVGYWYLVYHTLFWLDHYLSDVREEEFRPPEPFTLDEMDPAGLLPERPYTKEELRAYLHHGREKCRAVIEALDDREMFERKPPARPWRGGADSSVAEVFLYNMRHVQHHTAQLNLILRQRTGAEAPRWVSRAKMSLRGTTSAS
jgi:uncharacterized damage-inducible protein DinB